jgi:flagellar hook protein FlgE
MTLNSVLSVGVNALLAQSTRIGGISDNISNVNTIGYKGQTTDFFELIQSGGGVFAPSRAGARAVNQQLSGKQGVITQSTRSSDIAVNGAGFFVVTGDTSADSPLLYTRSGSFTPDENGNLRNSANLYLRGWELDTSGALPAALQTDTYDSATAISNLRLVNIAAATSDPVATSNVAIKANLDADQTLYSPTGNIQFTNNPSAGDTITINGVTWTFVASGATGTQTNIGGDLASTIAQLANDLNASVNTALTPATYSSTRVTTLGINHPGGRTTFTQNPAAGETVTINGVTWTFVETGAVGAQTNIGADIFTTLNNLASDLSTSGNPAVAPSTFSSINYEQLKVAYDAINGAAPTFSLASSSANGVVTPLLLYNAALATNNISGGAIPEQHIQPVQLIDNNGVERTINIGFLKTAVNTWAVEIYANPASDVTTVNGRIATGTMTFNGDGSLASVSASLTAPLTFPWADSGTIPTGSETATVNNVTTFNWGTLGSTDGYNQFATNYSVTAINQDGFQAGSLKRIDITDDGIVTSFFSNGASRALYVVPLAKFINPESLIGISGTVYKQSETSGFTNLYASNKGGAGTILSGSLESSTVDLATQLTDMIVAQRAYQSNTKSITTSDDMLRTLTELLR